MKIDKKSEGCSHWEFGFLHMRRNFEKRKFNEKVIPTHSAIIWEVKSSSKRRSLSVYFNPGIIIVAYTNTPHALTLPTRGKTGSRATLVNQLDWVRCVHAWSLWWKYRDRFCYTRWRRGFYSVFEKRLKNTSHLSVKVMVLKSGMNGCRWYI